MNKLFTKKPAIIAALCLAVLCCFIAAQGLTADTSKNSALTHKVTIRYQDLDGNPIAPSETREVKAGEMYKVSTIDGSADAGPSATETDEFHILTITCRDSEGNTIAPSVAKAVPACDAYCVGVIEDGTCTLTIDYVDSDGNPIAPSTTAELQAGSVYQVPGR